jgi:alpha-1,3-rhamnosyl/mannosyltransferase
MTLRVGMNAAALASPLTGIGNYIVHLGAALAASDDVDLHSFDGARWRHAPPSPFPDSAGASLARRARDAVKPWVPFKRQLRQAAQQLAFGRGLRRHAIELYHEPNYVSFRADVPVVTTVHDLSWLRYPQTHPLDRVRWLERSLPGAVARAAAVLVDSEFTRREVMATFSLPPERVHAVHLGVAPAFHPRDPVDTAASLRRLDLEHGGYVLTVGTIEPRKNIGHVLGAYRRLPMALRGRYALAVAGASGWRAAHLEDELRTLSGLGIVRFLGHVPNDVLPSLYAGAAAFLFPSLYEGFGLPPLEAMASGVPVLVSNRTSLPEIVGDAGVLLDPERPDRTAASLAAILDDPAARASLAERGIERAAAFTWDACCRRTLDVFRIAVQARRA